ncbi:MAG: helix-turn-helix domain-containing protein [Actinobacteria bacterium]|nr:helix-turn-helix domain-containing protein [Actinomycetota bacterium]
MMTASALLRAARSHRGISQRALADAAGIHQPRVAALEGATEDATVNRLAELLRVLGAQLTLVPSELRPVWAAADDVRRALGKDDERTAWREIIQLSDDLRAADAATCVTLAIAPPALTGDPHFDALLAAITDAALTDRQLPRPEWLDDERWRLAEPWDVEDVPALQRAARKATPAASKRHGIYLERAVLESV